jgi:hypothetical protein
VGRGVVEGGLLRERFVEGQPVQGPPAAVDAVDLLGGRALRENLQGQGVDVLEEPRGRPGATAHDVQQALPFRPGQSPRAEEGGQVPPGRCRQDGHLGDLARVAVEGQVGEGDAVQDLSVDHQRVLRYPDREGPGGVQVRAQFALERLERLVGCRMRWRVEGEDFDRRVEPVAAAGPPPAPATPLLLVRPPARAPQGGDLSPTGHVQDRAAVSRLS